ncbi:hypothetical protein HCN44_001196 [Aphidius gifuensis]|uniref:Uncharacterized protein n=1 Tax=Aphidius gifuensis TaxID=684658 RepID=A0A835CNY6_APHGI|nr:hypothetical protein HCN44_001196 [Aphidius gifuensis]
MTSAKSFAYILRYFRVDRHQCIYNAKWSQIHSIYSCGKNYCINSINFHCLYVIILHEKFQENDNTVESVIRCCVKVMMKNLKLSWTKKSI